MDNKVADKAENIIWEEQLSSKGNKYYIGHLEQDDSSIKDTSDGKEDFGITCDWYPSEFETWKNTSPDFARITGIKSYSVNKYGGIYSYIINFKNTEHYDYTFFDETGDSYTCNTFRNGEHFVRYNSLKPRIVYIKGD